MMSRRFLLVDDDDVFRGVLRRALERRGFSVREAGHIASAKEMCRDWRPDDVVLDLRLAEDSGLALLPELLAMAPQPRVLMLTGFASIETAVEAIKLGAIHYLPKPASANEILAALARDSGDPGMKVAEQPMSVNRLQWEHIQRVLAACDGNVSAAARALGMHRRTLQRKLQKKPVRR